jgi:hypothetical protein
MISEPPATRVEYEDTGFPAWAAADLTASPRSGLKEMLSLSTFTAPACRSSSYRDSDTAVLLCVRVGRLPVPLGPGAAVPAQPSVGRSTGWLRLHWSAPTGVDRAGPLRSTPGHNYGPL